MCNVRTVCCHSMCQSKIGDENERFKVLDVKHEKNEHFAWTELKILEKCEHYKLCQLSDRLEV